MAAAELDPDENLKPPEVAAWLKVTVDTLARWRCQGFGPTFQKFGRGVRYKRRDVAAWEASRRASSTAETAEYQPGLGDSGRGEDRS